MLLKVTMTRGENKRRITLCKPAVHQSTPILKDFYPDTAWLDSLPFDTAEFDLLISDEPIGDKAAVTLPRIPYATPAGDSYSRFEIRAGQNRHTRTSMEYPATQLLLNNRDLDPKIISEKKSILPRRLPGPDHRRPRRTRHRRGPTNDRRMPARRDRHRCVPTQRDRIRRGRTGDRHRPRFE